MISRTDLDVRVREWRLRHEVVEKDYVLGWVLWAIGADDILGRTWCFKGGTCLKKCFLETYRFSEDLDFTVLPGGPTHAEEIVPRMRLALARAAEESGVDFGIREPKFTTKTSGGLTDGRVYYRGPRRAPQDSSIKLDISAKETVVRPTVLRPIFHAYPDILPATAVVRCYGFEEVLAEKIRALHERERPRDLYDVVSLFRRGDFLDHGRAIKDLLFEKCDKKGIPRPTRGDLTAPKRPDELHADWDTMLAHQLPDLPPIESFIAEMPNIAAWLFDDALPTALTDIHHTLEAESLDATWRPPPTMWVWGEGVPIETIRFAAANHLCIDLDYNGTTRRIEPYSFRRTRTGALLLFAVKTESGEVRSYRVDRLQGATVTNVVFSPRFRVEMSAGGGIGAPLSVAVRPPAP